MVEVVRSHDMDDFDSSEIDDSKPRLGLDFRIGTCDDSEDRSNVCAFAWSFATWDA